MTRLSKRVSIRELLLAEASDRLISGSSTSTGTPASRRCGDLVGTERSVRP
jgi:hypothetical protein